MDVIKLNVNGAIVDVPKETFSQAVEKGELKIENQDLVIKNKTDFDTFIENTTRERYNAGLEVGEKRAVTTVSEKFGVKLDEQKKTVENFANILKSTLEKELKVEPDKRITELQRDKETLQSNYSTLEGTYNNMLTQIKQTQKNDYINKKLIESIPRLQDGKTIETKIPVEDIILLFKQRYELDIDDTGKEIVKQSGIVLKNATNLNELSFKDVFSTFVKDYTKPVEGGAGGGDSSGNAAPGSLEAFKKEMEEKNITGVQLNEEMFKRIKAGTLK